MKPSMALALLAGSAGLFVATTVNSQDSQESEWWSPGDVHELPAQVDYANDSGVLRVLFTDEEVRTTQNAFFQPIGANGRACVSCHQPSDSMSLSAETARERWDATDGRDPIFAAVDGSNCPSMPQGERASHSLLLDYGLFRIERPWPPRDANGAPVETDFEIEVVRDPWGCNIGDRGPDAGNISVYRRPRPVANMKYLLAIGFPQDPKLGRPVPVDPRTGEPTSGNLLADRRALTLDAQMDDAGAAHLEMARAMTPQQRSEITQFLMSVYAAQQRDASGTELNANGAEGGPQYLADSPAGMLGAYGKRVWSEFEPWEQMSEEQLAELSEEEREYRASVARGARIFRDETFLITDSAGINFPTFGNPFRQACTMCHNMTNMGNDVAPGQIDLGTQNAPFADPAPHLPLFRVTCTGEPHPYYGTEILTHDPGFALTTGRCLDVGKITAQSLRGLAARAPYFSNGSAATLRDVVDFYDRRYNLQYTEQEKIDLVNMMGAL